MPRKLRRKVEVFHFWAGPEQAPVDSFLDRFQRENPSIRVERNALEWSIYSMMTKARIARGDPPDVMVDDVGQRMKESAKGGKIANLTGLWRREKFSDVFSAWLKEAASLNGKVYGIPSKCFTFAVWYLKDTFEKHEVEPPATWDEFLTLCERFRKAGLFPIVASGWEVSLWFENILARTCGPKFYNMLMGNRESWTNPRVIDSFDMLRDLSEKYFHPYPFGFSFREAWKKLNAREAAMQLQGDWVNGMWQREYGYSSGEEYDYFLVPPISPGVGQVMVIGGNVWVAPKHAAHREEAEIFLRYAGSLEAHEILAAGGMGILARKDVPDNCYDEISAGLKNELQKNPTVLQIGSLFPSWMTSVQELQLIQIILDPKLSRSKVRKLAEEIQLAADKAMKT